MLTVKLAYLENHISLNFYQKLISKPKKPYITLKTFLIENM